MSREGALVFTTDDMPGITRKRRGKGFSYHDAKGKLIRQGGTPAHRQPGHPARL